MDLFTYQAKVLRVIDGDTLEVELDLGLRCYRRERIRILGMDAPETRRSGGVDKRFEGYSSKAFLELLLIGAVQARTRAKLEDFRDDAPEDYRDSLDHLREAIRRAPGILPVVSFAGQKARIIVKTERGDAFGRWLGKVWLPSHSDDDHLDLAELMISLGLAKAMG